MLPAPGRAQAAACQRAAVSSRWGSADGVRRGSAGRRAASGLSVCSDTLCLCPQRRGTHRTGVSAAGDPVNGPCGIQPVSFQNQRGSL